ncbi:HAD-like domain-containing protein [Echria macrotheca]|uniref:HAD-like domain-containing protein n=1 Tax=Echria macrotheca TaxID=438768 RepID=A0AAJ0BAW9_9PEZI|nr:HAD-like domain-containing protein [Echria macrotheca]
MKDLTTFKALSFDCYGTLLDWETGLLSDLHPLLTLLPSTHPWTSSPSLALDRFNVHSEHLWATEPTLPYDANLSESFRLLAAEADLPLSSHPSLPPAAERIATGPSRWTAFPDTIPGLLSLKQHYRLIILSNVDDANIAGAVRDNLSPVQFDGVYTAQSIGSYKPSLNNFHYLFEHAKRDFGVDWERGELLHVARGLTADHVPAKKLGLPSVWISRGGDTEDGYGIGGDLKELQERGEVGFGWRFESIGEFAGEVERQFAEKEKAGTDKGEGRTE